MDTDYIDSNYAACLEIEAALESLINLSDIVDSIAMEAVATAEGEKPESVNKEKKKLAVKKMAEEWMQRFKDWSADYDKEVTAPRRLSENLVYNTVKKICDAVPDETRSHNDIDPKIAAKQKAELEKALADLEAHLKELDPKDVTKKDGLFRAARKLFLKKFKQTTDKLEVENYAESIREQIKYGNKLMAALDKRNYLAKDYADTLERASGNVLNKQHDVIRKGNERYREMRARDDRRVERAKEKYANRSKILESRRFMDYK